MHMDSTTADNFWCRKIAPLGRSSEGPRPPSESGGAPLDRPRRERAAFGLSSVPYLAASSESTHTLRYAEGGNLVQVVPLERPDGGVKAILRPTRGKRGGTKRAISKFTRKSRWNLKLHFDRLDRKRTKRALMVTLTYAENMTDGRRAKRHLDAFFKAVDRAYGKPGQFWKMECQERGSLHFHLLIFGVRKNFIPYEWVADTWCRIVGGDERQRAAGTRVEAAKSLFEVRSYLEKYLGKVLQTDGDAVDNPGRWWGVRHLERFQAPVKEHPLTPAQAVQVTRLLNRLHKARVLRDWRQRPALCGGMTNGQVLAVNARRARLGVQVEPDYQYQPAHLWMVTWARRRKSGVLKHTCTWRTPLDHRLAAQLLALFSTAENSYPPDEMDPGGVSRVAAEQKSGDRSSSWRSCL